MNDSLYAISCTSPKACTAVGLYQPTSTTSLGLAERWNGEAWKQQTATGLGTGSALRGVSCTSATACVAVGGGSNGILTAQWDGKSWAQQTVVTPEPGDLQGVSCRTTTLCTAVGGHTLGEQLNGDTWSQQTVPSPATYGGLEAVSCTNATACTAVGSYSDGPAGPEATLADRWNGKVWTQQTTPRPGMYSFLLGVSCTSATACTAVGQYEKPGSEAYVPLIERWNGKKWVQQAAANSDAPSVLAGVSCTSATACTAVGGSKGLTLAEHWNGKKWTRQATPNIDTGDILRGVSCTSATACTAVGYYSETLFTNVFALAERWSGKKWTRQTIPTVG